MVGAGVSRDLACEPAAGCGNVSNYTQTPSSGSRSAGIPPSIIPSKMSQPAQRASQIRFPSKSSFYSPLTPAELRLVCDFLDTIPVLRSKLNKAWLNRDFADGGKCLFRAIKCLQTYCSAFRTIDTLLLPESRRNVQLPKRDVDSS